MNKNSSQIGCYAVDDYNTLINIGTKIQAIQTTKTTVQS